jgi:D-glycero-D-manno-heptose 1,7-bisphosphate phosphatase
MNQETSVSGIRRAVFLDRDGVINKAVVRNGVPFPPASLEETKIIPGVKEGLSLLKDANYMLIVVTNQPDVARGKVEKKNVEAINSWLSQSLPLDEIRTCYHDDVDKCDCRKPKPGLILESAHLHNIDLRQSFMIGDRWRDIAAGEAAGCRTIFIDYGYAEQQPDISVQRMESLLLASQSIINKNL